jgi:cyclophilin family peptidyl-prolyl cis-trans isomerase
VAKGLADSSPRVRYEALQTWSRLPRSSCKPLHAALTDRSPHVVLLAIDLLGAGCPGDEARDPLRKLATASVDSPRGWHRPARALVSLARVSADDARALLRAHTEHAIWQVRMYAARAAGVLSDVDTLSRLARDQHHNVREAALSALVTLKRTEAVALAVEALSSSDYQLVMTAARAASATTDASAVLPALQRAYDRIRAEKRDTARDALNALREAVKTLGGPDLPAPVANRIVPKVPSTGEIAVLAQTRVRFTMAGLGAFELRLLPQEAPVTAAHIAALAREGYYNALTFHRVVPNFVLQGGSPGANEYAGQGPFMRDEVGLQSHRRGTVGISTRGRDTGDAQIFINLVDSPRLDHTYTVFAEVVSGMDVIDAILEGDVIERVELVSPTS